MIASAHRTLHIDAQAGIAGDMLLAALAHSGFSLHPLQAMFAGLASIEVIPETRRGIAGCRVAIVSKSEQPMRHLPELLDIVAKLSISEAVQQRAGGVLERLAQAEAAVHAVPVERIHFHEVGAVDTLVDIVGACWAMEQLGVKHVSGSAVPWCTGTVCCEHGELPLPAPATVQLLRGVPVFPTERKWELVTPTGAVLFASLVDAFSDGPEGVLLASGTGYGTKEAGGGLRVFLCEALEQSAGQRDAAPRSSTPAATTQDAPGMEAIWVLECCLDHLTGEELGAAIESLMACGALDVLYLQGVMKKNRPGGLLQVLCREEDVEDLEAAVFRATCTLGLRRTRTWRRVLPREQIVLETPLGALTAKQASRDVLEAGSEEGAEQPTSILRPEHTAMATLARELGLSVPELRLRLMGTF